MFTEKRPEKETEEPKLPQIQEIEDTPNTSLFEIQRDFVACKVQPATPFPHPLLFRKEASRRILLRQDDPIDQSSRILVLCNPV